MNLTEDMSDAHRAAHGEDFWVNYLFNHANIFPNLSRLSFFPMSQLDDDRWVGVCFGIRYVFTRDRLLEPTTFRLIFKQGDSDGLEFRFSCIGTHPSCQDLNSAIPLSSLLNLWRKGTRTCHPLTSSSLS